MSTGTERIVKIATLLILAGVAALGVHPSWAGGPGKEVDELFARGNRAYAEGKYDEAISFYKRIIGRAGYSASLLYNMANAYYMKRDAGRAVLNYERALCLEPGNADIRRNLELTRRNFDLGRESTPGWRRFFTPITLNRWALVGSLALGAFSLLFFLRNLDPRLVGKVPSRIVAACSVLCILAGASGVAVQYGNTMDRVVVADGSQLRISPFDSASAVSSLPDGRVVSIDRSYRGYLFVNGPGGRSGWIKKSAVEPVVPSGRRT